MSRRRSICVPIKMQHILPAFTRKRLTCSVAIIYGRLVCCLCCEKKVKFVGELMLLAAFCWQSFLTAIWKNSVVDKMKNRIDDKSHHHFCCFFLSFYSLLLSFNPSTCLVLPSFRDFSSAHTLPLAWNFPMLTQ